MELGARAAELAAVVAGGAALCRAARERFLLAVDALVALGADAYATTAAPVGSAFHGHWRHARVVRNLAEAAPPTARAAA